MKFTSTPTQASSQRTCSTGSSTRSPLWRMGLVALAVTASSAGHAIDFGPDGMFSLNGFGQVTLGGYNNRCLDCQWVGPTEGKQKIWADVLLPGQPIQSVTTLNYQVQPYLGAKIDLGKGFKLSGLLSRRWRDGVVDGDMVYDGRYGSKEDVPGFWYDKSIALSHEEYGRLTIGHMLTRSWSEADYPFGSNLGLSDVWANSGSGYGMLTNAIRYQSRVLDFAEGDLILEATYDRGDTNFKKNKPRFFELHAKYYRGPMELDVILQDSKNGGPSAWGHSPFTGLTPFSEDDPLLSGSSQNMAMFMGRYWVTPQLQLSAGLRRNAWSGANAVQNPATLQWNNMFNVDWNGTRNGVMNPGYAATSYDVIAGARYRMGKWTPSIGFAHLGTASTDNPSERGQSNSALFGVLGLQYDYGNGLKIDLQAGAVRYAQLGLSPMSMPGNDSFTSVDSRIKRNGQWLTVQIGYSF